MFRFEDSYGRQLIVLKYKSRTRKIDSTWSFFGFYMGIFSGWFKIHNPPPTTMLAGYSDAFRALKEVMLYVSR